MMIQILANGCIDGLVIGVLAISFGLIYNTLKIFHFAFGAFYSLAAYVFYAGFGWWSLIFTPLTIILVEIFLYYPLHEKGATLAVSMISSLGLYIILINAIVLFFGNDTKLLTNHIPVTFQFHSIIVTIIQIWIVVLSLLICGATLIILHFTKFGNLITAAGENPTLFSVMGKSIRFVRIAAILSGTLFASIMAILKGLDIGIDPYMGMGYMLTAAIAFIISGGKKYQFMIIAGLLLGVVRNLSVWYFSAQWMDSITFIILIVILLTKKAGLSEQSLRIEEV